MAVDFEYLPEFEKELERLSKKRFRSLPEDLEVLKKVLSVAPSAAPPISFSISNLNVPHEIVKVKKFACRALKGRGANSGIRVVYAFHKEEQKVVFIQIYFKGDQANEDRGRIHKYYG